MASFNRVILIGRLCADPESRTFANGGKVANFRFAVEQGRKKNASGQWEGETCFVDVAAFNRGENGTLANVVEQYCRKGSLICVEGKLTMESWDDKTSGQKRTKHKIVADSIQLLGSRDENGSSSRPASTSQNRTSYQYQPGDANEAPSTGGDDDIPF